MDERRPLPQAIEGDYDGTQ